MQALQVPPSPLVSWRFVRGDCSVRSDATATNAPRQYHDFPCGAKPHLETYMRPGSSRMCLGHILNVVSAGGAVSGERLCAAASLRGGV